MSSDACTFRVLAAEDQSISDKELLVTYRFEGDTFSMSRPTGQSYAAKLNGPEAPYKGDPDTNSVALKRLDKNTIEETDKLNGKVARDRRSGREVHDGLGARQDDQPVRHRETVVKVQLLRVAALGARTRLSLG